MNDDKRRASSQSSSDERAGDEELLRLLTAAGRRSPLPDEDLASIKAAAEADWRRLVEEQHHGRRAWRRGVLALAATLLLAFAVGLWWRAFRTPVLPGSIATVELLQGAVRLEGPAARETPSQLAVGEELPAGAVLETLAGDESAGLAVRLAGGESVRVAPDSRIRLSSPRLLELERGAVYIDTAQAAPAAGALELLTPIAIVREVGTQYEVRLLDGQDPAVRVRVRDGAVALTYGDEVYQATSGQEVTLRGGGSVALATVEPYGPIWEWVVRAAPGFEIEGRTLASYLDWVARETGWSLRFADPVLERSAATVILHGSIEGLGPLESLSVILPGSGLDHHLESGALTIVRTAGDRGAD